MTGDLETLDEMESMDRCVMDFRIWMDVGRSGGGGVDA